MNDKIAIVTGASRIKGLGAAICRELADNGYDIFFTYWSNYDKEMSWGIAQDEPLKLKEELLTKGIKASCIELDLTRDSAASVLFDTVEKEMGEPSVLLNNAAYSTNNDYSTLKPADLDAHYMINIRATTLLSIEFAKRFKKAGGGRIINMTSGQFKGPMPGELAYATTKGAIDALTITLAAELAPKKITVNAINPGPTDTGWMDDAIKNELSPRFPFGRLGNPKDAARLARFLASEDAEWITGQILHSEGGFIR